MTKDLWQLPSSAEALLVRLETHTSLYSDDTDEGSVHQSYECAWALSGYDARSLDRGRLVEMVPAQTSGGLARTVLLSEISVAL